MSSTEIILNSLDIVLAEIRSGLDFDENNIDIAHVADAVKIANLDFHGISWSAVGDNSIQRDLSFTLHDVPMFGAPFMTLVGETLSGSDPDAFDLEKGGLLKDLIPTPWADRTL